MAQPQIERSFLFADVKGYSSLKDGEYDQYITDILPIMSTAVKKYEPQHKNTWGDAIFAVFEDSHRAANCAFELCEEFHKINWDSLSFSNELKIRVALHAGRCRETTNPLTGFPEYLGHHINPTARIEPIVGGNQVWATEHFMHILTSSPFKPLFRQDLGERELVKGAGRMKLSRISRFPFDLDEAIKNDFYQNLDDYIHGIHHINLPVVDLQKSIEFYKTVLLLKQLPQSYDAKRENIIRAYCKEYGLPLLDMSTSLEKILPGRYRLPFEFPGAWLDMPNLQQVHLILHRPDRDKMQPTFRVENELNFKDVHFAFRVKDYDSMKEIHEQTPGINFQPGPMGLQYYITDPDNHIIEITGMDGLSLQS